MPSGLERCVGAYLPVCLHDDRFGHSRITIFVHSNWGYCDCLRGQPASEEESLPGRDRAVAMQRLLWNGTYFSSRCDGAHTHSNSAGLSLQVWVWEEFCATILFPLHWRRMTAGFARLPWLNNHKVWIALRLIYDAFNTLCSNNQYISRGNAVQMIIPRKCCVRLYTTFNGYCIGNTTPPMCITWSGYEKVWLAGLRLQVWKMRF